MDDLLTVLEEAEREWKRQESEPEDAANEEYNRALLIDHLGAIVHTFRQMREQSNTVT